MSASVVNSLLQPILTSSSQVFTLHAAFDLPVGGWLSEWTHPRDQQINEITQYRGVAKCPWNLLGNWLINKIWRQIAVTPKYSWQKHSTSYKIQQLQHSRNEKNWGIEWTMYKSRKVSCTTWLQLKSQSKACIVDTTCRVLPRWCIQLGCWWWDALFHRRWSVARWPVQMSRQQHP